MGNCQSRVCCCSETISETSVNNRALKRGRNFDKCALSPSESVKSANSERGYQSSRSSPQSPLTPLERLQRARNRCTKWQSRLEEALARSERLRQSVTSGSEERSFLSCSSCDSRNEHHGDAEDNYSARSGSVASFLARLRGSTEDLRRNPTCGASGQEFDSASALEELSDDLPDWLINDLAAVSSGTLSPGEIPDSLDPEIAALLPEGSICPSISSNSFSITHSPLRGPPSPDTDANRTNSTRSISDSSPSPTISHLFDPPRAVRQRASVRRHSVEGSVTSSGSEDNVNAENIQERQLPTMHTVVQRFQGYLRRTTLRNAVRPLERFSRSIDRSTRQFQSNLPSSGRPTGDSTQLSNFGNSGSVESTSLNDASPRRWLSALRRSSRPSARVSPSPYNSGPAQSNSVSNSPPRRWLSALRRSPRSSARVSPSPGKVKKIEVQPDDDNKTKMFCIIQPSLTVDPIMVETSVIEHRSCEQASGSTPASPSAASTSTITSMSSFEFEEVINLSSPALDTTTNASPAADCGGT